MQLFQFLARAVFCVISLVLVVLAGGLIVYAGMQLWEVFGEPESDIGASLLESVGYTVIAIAVFEVAKYILEEEVLDPTQMRHTGEARRSITKFVSTIIIAVFLEALVTIFQASKEPDLSAMLYPTILLFAAVALIVGLGAYQRLSTAAEREVRSSPEAAAEERAELDKH
ncbi:MAG TPA: GNAT family acetyltransferase [Propylenella sp.]|nr:GNAT family acetyltransferase [Propylenella sp.]